MQNIVQSFYDWYRQTLRHPKYRWLLIGASLLYLLSPIDVAPDFIPIMGWIDDGIVATLLVTEVSQLLLARLKEGQKAPTQMDTQETEATDTEKTVVDVTVS